MARAQRVQVHVDPPLSTPSPPGRPASTARKVTLACADSPRPQRAPAKAPAEPAACADSPGRRRAPAKSPAEPAASAALELAVLGLRVGESVRWRRPGAGAWQLGVVTRRERD